METNKRRGGKEILKGQRQTEIQLNKIDRRTDADRCRQGHKTKTNTDRRDRHKHNTHT